MKLRKSGVISPRSFRTPHCIFKDLHRGTADFLHRDANELIQYHASALPLLVARPQWREIFIGVKIHFHAGENLFSSRRKSIFIGKKIFCHGEGTLQSPRISYLCNQSNEG